MRICRSFVATTLMAVTACLPLMGSDGGTLSPMAGTVAVNGQVIAQGSAISAGDVVSTSSDGSARMMLNGSSVVAASKTKFRIERKANVNNIRLTYGMVEVSGHVPVLLKTRTIVPASARANYIVTALNGPVYVTAKSGNVKILAFGRSYMVRAGEAATFQDQNTTTTTTTTGDQNAQTNTTTPPASTDQNAQSSATAGTTDQSAQSSATTTTTPPDQNAASSQAGTTTAPTTTADQNAAQSTTTTTGDQTTTTTTTTEATGGGGSAGVALPLAIGLAAAAAVVTGIIVHQATKTSSPSQ